MKQLTQEQINAIVEKHSKKAGFRPTPVQNFLGSLSSQDTERSARMNLNMDANMYKWKAPIVAAINEGIKLSFK
jgi:hypothetical protein